MCGCVMVIMLVCLIDVVTGVTPMASVLKPHLGKSWCKVPSSSRVFTVQYSVDGIYLYIENKTIVVVMSREEKK